MRIVFHLPEALREFGDGQSRVEVDVPAATLGDALAALWTRYPGVRDRIADEQGQVREHINIFVGDENMRYTGGLATSIDSASEISIVPAISGGAEGVQKSVMQSGNKIRKYFRINSAVNVGA